MKKDKELLVLEEWKAIARLDWKRAKRNLRDKDPVAAAFFVEQSLEKFLKAFLLSHGWTLRKIHRLDALLDEAAKHNPDLENFRGLCEHISGYYMADRYPPIGFLEVTSEDVRKDLKETKGFIKAMFPEENMRA
jgi:HEPN domain-containing protein